MWLSFAIEGKIKYTHRGIQSTFQCEVCCKVEAEYRTVRDQVSTDVSMFHSENSAVHQGQGGGIDGEERGYAVGYILLLNFIWNSTHNLIVLMSSITFELFYFIE